MVKQGDLILPASFKQTPAPHAQANAVTQRGNPRRNVECNVIVIVDEEYEQEAQKVSKSKEKKNENEIKEKKNEERKNENEKNKENIKEEKMIKKEELKEEKEELVTYYYDGSEDENEAIYSGLFSKDLFKEEDCHVNLRPGTNIPERQAPKEVEKGKGKSKAPEENDGQGPNQKARKTKGDYNILAHLRRTPALISIFEALMMSKELRETMMEALQDPEKFQAYLVEKHITKTLYVEPQSQITFTERDLMMGTARHNKPLYITGKTNGSQLSRMLVDPGSSINILPLKSLNQLALGARRLSDENVFIHGFNQNAERALGAITLPMRFGDLETLIKFYVIDVDTSYRALLGRPWLHENGLVPSTLHQCVKYLHDGEQKMIKGEAQHYGVHEIELEEIDRFYTPTSQRSTSPNLRPRVASREECDEKSWLKERLKTSYTAKTTIYIKSSDEESEKESKKGNVCIIIDSEGEWDQGQRNTIYAYDIDSEEEFSEGEDSVATEQRPHWFNFL